MPGGFGGLEMAGRKYSSSKRDRGWHQYSK